MSGINKVIIIGSLGKDPVTRATQSGVKVSSFSVAVSEKFKDRNGEQQEKTEWINIVVWDKLAGICEQYLKKGSKVYLEGKLSTSSWDTAQGEKRYKTEVVANNMQMLGGKPQGQAPQQMETPPDNYQGGFESQDDDLPF